VSDCASCDAPCGGSPNPKRVVIDDSNIAQAQSGMIGGFFIRPMELSPNGRHEGHSHYIDHVSSILKGPLMVEWRNEVTGEEGILEVSGPCKLLIKADVHHTFIAGPEGAKWECWFAEAHNTGDKPVSFHQERASV
jgi:hypothetical protein